MSAFSSAALGFQKKNWEESTEGSNIAHMQSLILTFGKFATLNEPILICDY